MQKVAVAYLKQTGDHQGCKAPTKITVRCGITVFILNYLANKLPYYSESAYMTLVNLLNPKKTENVCTVRLTTTYWSNATGVHTKKSLVFLRRQCKGYNIFEEDSSNMGASEVLPYVTNLYECRDGVYRVKLCNVSKDFETGQVDYYDYVLMPVE